MFEYLMLGDVRARKYSKTGARTHSILEKFAFDTTLHEGPMGISWRPYPDDPGLQEGMVLSNEPGFYQGTIHK